MQNMAIPKDESITESSCPAVIVCVGLSVKATTSTGHMDLVEHFMAVKMT